MGLVCSENFSDVKLKQDAHVPSTPVQREEQKVPQLSTNILKFRHLTSRRYTRAVFISSFSNFTSRSKKHVKSLTLHKLSPVTNSKPILSFSNFRTLLWKFMNWGNLFAKTVSAEASSTRSPGLQSFNKISHNRTLFCSGCSICF